MLDQLDQDCLEIIFRYCLSDELLSLYCVHSKMVKVIERLESIHVEHANTVPTLNHKDENNLNIHDRDDKKERTNSSVATIYSPFLKPSNLKECEETKYRLQIFHPSYTVYVLNTFKNDIIGEWVNYLVDHMNFKLVIDDGNSMIVEREVFKTSFVKNLREKLRKMVGTMEDSGIVVNSGIINIIDTEFKPYSTKNKQCLINFYERVTLRLVFKRNESIPNNFVLASGQNFYIYQGNRSRYPGLDCTTSSDYSDQIVGIKSMVDFFGNTQTICNLMLCMILQQRMPKYYFENYRVPEELDARKYLALVDVFYYEMLSSNTRLSSIPVFLTQNYLNTPFELFKYGLEMCIDLLYNQIGTRKKIDLIEKLISTYLNQDFTQEQLKTIHSLSSLKPSDLKENKYTTVGIEREKLTFSVVCLETITTIKEKRPPGINSDLSISEERIKIVTIKIMEYTFQLPNLFNGNTVGGIKISTRNLTPSSVTNNETAPINNPPTISTSPCSLL